MHRATIASIGFCFAAIAYATAGEPAEELIVYTALRPANYDIYLFDEPGGPPRRLTTDLALDYNATFSPDGSWVVFCSERRGSADLYAVELNEPSAPVLLTPSDTMEDAPCVSPDGKQVVFVSTRDGNADVWIMPFAPGDRSAWAAAVNLTHHAGGDFNPAFSPDGSKIAFASDRDGYRASEIYVMDVDGANVRRLTMADGWDGSPAWTADARHVYYYGQHQGREQLYRVGIAGGEPQVVAAAYDHALSPAMTTGGRVAFSLLRGGRSGIVSIAADGGQPRDESDDQRDYWAPAFDPSGKRMVCHGTGPAAPQSEFASRTPGPFLVDNQIRVALADRRLAVWAVRGYFPSLDPTSTRLVCDADFARIVTCRLDGTDIRTVFEPQGGSAWRPDWAKSGQWIVCTAGPTFADPRTRADVWKFRPDGSDAANLTANSAANDAFGAFSPDGRRVVFRSGRDGNHEIYLIDADGTGLRRLTNDEATDTMPAFSPQGDRIAFTSNRTGDYEVYTLAIEADGQPSSLRRITDSPGRDTHPKFSPDGRWLVVASERGGINDEEPLIAVFNPQPYGEICVVDLDDLSVVRLTHNKWEDGTPTWGAVHAAASDR